MSAPTDSGTWLPYNRVATEAGWSGPSLMQIEPAGFRATADYYRLDGKKSFLSPSGIRVLAAFVRQRGYPTTADRLEALAHSGEVESAQRQSRPSRQPIDAAFKSSEASRPAWLDRKDVNG